MKHEAKSGTAFNATAIRHRGLSSGLRAGSIWSFRNFSPVRFLDPAKAINLMAQGLLGYYTPELRKFTAHGSVIPDGLHMKRWDSIRDIIHKMAPGVLQRLEPLIIPSSAQLLWEDGYHNLVVNVGLDDVLNKYFKGSAYTAAHYLGLTAASPAPAAGHTMSSHAGWTELHAEYDEGTRPAITWGTVSGQSVDNTASPASYSINTNSTSVGGGFCVDDNTKNGTGGILYSCGAFSANKPVDDGDTLQVDITATQADDGV